MAHAGINALADPAEDEGSLLGIDDGDMDPEGPPLGVDDGTTDDEGAQLTDGRAGLMIIDFDEEVGTSLGVIDGSDDPEGNTDGFPLGSNDGSDEPDGVGVSLAIPGDECISGEFSRKDTFMGLYDDINKHRDAGDSDKTGSHLYNESTGARSYRLLD